MLKKLYTSGMSWLWITLLLIVIDRYSKDWVVHSLPFNEPINIFSILNLTLVYNTGAAFSFLHSASGWQNIVLGGIAFIVSITIVYWLYKLSSRDRWVNIALCLILAGALGNAWDRILYGYVIDFLDFHLGDWHFFIFNIADSAISVGGAMLFLYCMGFQQERT